MSNKERIIDDYIWKQLIIRGGLFDDYQTVHRHKKAIEYTDVIYKCKPMQMWRHADRPIIALRYLLSNGVPVSFLRANIGIIARNFIWEKQTRGLIDECELNGAVSIDTKYELHNITALRGWRILKYTSIVPRECRSGIISEGHMSGKVFDIRGTNQIGVVSLAILNYWKYVQKTTNILRDIAS